jgi:ribosomal protein S18 acetylase RimI-like enzyme
MASFMASIQRHLESARHFYPYGRWDSPEELIAKVRQLVTDTQASQDLYFLGLQKGSGLTLAHGFLRGWQKGCASAEIGLAVLPMKQGLGFGRKMLEHLVQAAREHGDAEVWLTVNRDNYRAVDLYRSVGFEMGPCDLHLDRFRGALQLR